MNTTKRIFSFVCPITGKTMKFKDGDSMTLNIDIENHIYDVLTEDQVVQITKNVLKKYDVFLDKLPDGFVFNIYINILRLEKL